MRVGFSSSNELTSVESDETSLDSDVLSIFKDECSSVDGNSFENGSVLVDQESGALGDNDEVIGHWRDVDAPSSRVAPLQNVKEVVSENGTTGS